MDIYSSPMASLVLTESSQLTSDSQHLAFQHLMRMEEIMPKQALQSKEKGRGPNWKTTDKIDGPSAGHGD
uniref:Uncharacterized protein n=1 Tax=Timema bartmani TaxID=61472 RepID=A0A7R9F344_9NEOP|nr:unnamed protein product [Timema bartmani]